MFFGEAVQSLKNGKKVARKNWKDGEYVVLADDISFHTDANIGDLQGKKCMTDDCLCFKTSDNIFQLGWSPTQADMLSEDWEIVK